MGYGREQFQERVGENLICPICHKVLQDPLQCKDGHLFCRDCIIEWLKNNQKCPMDNNPLQANNLAHGKFVKEMLDVLNVYCHPPTGRVERCEWTGELQSLTEHRKTCPFQQVRCPHVTCNKVMQRRELEDHDKVCKFKRVECAKCSKVLVRHVLQTHIDVECPEVVVPCPNGCTSQQGQTKLKRVDLDNHLTNICAKAIVDCPYKDQGCSVQVERQEVEKHVQGNIAAHMMLLAKQCSEQYSSLAEQCSSLTKKCSAHTEQYSVLYIENQVLKVELQKVKARLSSTNTYTWVIYNFPALCDKHSNGSQLRSPTFWLCGYKLTLDIYPNGFDRDVSGFISLYLNLHEEYPDTPRRVTKVTNSESALKFRDDNCSLVFFMAGYKAEQFVDRIDANLVCPICHDVLRDPMQCREGHSFCRYCVERWLKVTQKCPMDNCFIRDDCLSCNLALRGVIHNMKVYCHPKNSEENWETTETSQGSKDTTQKCSWIGTLQDLPTHQKTCPFQLIHCSHINCIVKLQRKQIKEHEDSCKYKTITCDQCGLVLVRFELENHKKNGCPETEIPCPNECTDVEE